MGGLSAIRSNVGASEVFPIARWEGLSTIPRILFEQGPEQHFEVPQGPRVERREGEKERKTRGHTQEKARKTEQTRKQARMTRTSFTNMSHCYG